jgi:hypothetical protein
VLLFTEEGRGDEGDTTTLALTETTWEWEDPTGAASSWPYQLDDRGLIVDLVQLLPPRVGTGSEAEGTRVTATGATEVYYGTFDDTVTVEVSDGSFAGTAVFASGLGPVRLTVAGVALELVYYQGVVLGDEE